MPPFDVFLSHNSVDKPWVIKLKDDLLRYEVSVWLDRDEIRPGDLFAKALEEGLQSSRAVVLVVSPEAMASGWVQEEYYRPLSLAKDPQAPLQLIPVILRDAEVPGFLQSRNWVDFRDETTYAQSVWRLVWGITGQKPSQVLDLSAPAPHRLAPGQPPIPPEAPIPSPPQPQTSPPGPSHFRTGGVKAGRDIQADNIVIGVQVQSADAETARELLKLAQTIESGSVEAVQDIIARNIVTGLQYLGQGGSEPNRRQFQRELAALREQVAQAIAAGEIGGAYDAEDAQRAVDRTIEQVQAEKPVAEKITSQLDRAATIINKAVTVAESAGKLQATVIKLAPIVVALKKLAGAFF